MHRLSTRTRLATAVALLGLLLAACGGETDPAEEATEPTPAEQATTPEAAGTAEADAATTVAVASSDLGDILVDGEGRTLYAFLPDDRGEPTCTEGCAETWPPLEGAAEAGEGAQADLLGTVEHPNGTTQVTYNDWPLYHFANDEQPGDTNGQGVGDNWYVVGPDGEPIQEAAAQGAAGSGY